ncbi:MAG: hypothetical protein U0792_06290 [Gemmataceae bacterium]
MGRILFCVVFAVLACGCRWKAPPHVPGATPATEDGFKLPEAASGNPVENATENDVLLNVSSVGDVLPPNDGPSDSRPLGSLTEVEDFLRRRADTERMQTSKEKPEGVPILRIDRNTPFERAYPVLRACRLAGYEKYQLRVVRSSAEVQISLTFEPGEPAHDPFAEPPKQYAVKVTADESGHITSLNLREYGAIDEESENIAGDLATYQKKLTAITTHEKKRSALAETKGSKIPPPVLTIELPDRLLHGSVVELLDMALQAGFANVWLVPIDPTKR